jgi:hypothetical protein
MILQHPSVSRKPLGSDCHVVAVGADVDTPLSHNSKTGDAARVVGDRSADYFAIRFVQNERRVNGHLKLALANTP